MEATKADDGYSADLPSFLITTPKKRASVWSPSEELFLIEEVVANEELLFGQLKGPAAKAISRNRTEMWAGIADKITARFGMAKQEVEEVKKKFFNLKQRAKQKIDKQRNERKKTGGGEEPKSGLTTAENAIVLSMEGRPVLTGLTCGVDTDAQAPMKDSCEGIGVKESHTEGCGEKRKEGSLENCADSDRKKRKRHMNEEQNEETLKNTKLDTERILLENQKLTLEIEKLKTEIACLKTKSCAFSSIKAVADTINLYYQQQLGLNIISQDIDFTSNI